jgi:arylsulfatase A-like enzyme
VWLPRFDRRALAIGALSSSLLLGVGCSGRSSDPPRPNILLVSIDSLRADHVHSYGYDKETTPNIDQLADSGVRFENMISSASWTVPAHMTMLTGLPPEVHRVDTYKSVLSPDALTMAQMLQSAGYDTAGFVSGPTVTAQHGFGQGFASFDETMVNPVRALSRLGTTSPGLVKLVNGYLDRWNGNGRRAPFFVFLHMWDVHYDYSPPKPYDTMFDPDYTGDLTSEDFSRNKRINKDMDKRDLQHLIALYDGEIRLTDDNLGQVFDKLRALGVFDDTIVAVTADHGEEFFEHGSKGHAKTLYDEVLRIPLVIRYPRRLPAQRIQQQVRLMDLAPTILGLAAVPFPSTFALGKMALPYRPVDLTPWLTGDRPRPTMPKLPAFSEIRGLAGHQQSIRTRTEKVIHYDLVRRGRPTTEVFDLAKDPGEHDDIVGTPPGVVISQDLTPADLTWNALTSAETKLARTEEPSEESKERLRSLGYVQ